MGKRKKLFCSHFATRQRLSRAADDRVALAIVHATRAAEQQSLMLWWIAGKHFEIAASLYRQAGLGLLAKSQLLSRAACFEEIGNADAAATCRRQAESIPAYWEDTE